MVSYNRFVELMPTVISPLLAYLQQCQSTCRGISFVDSTSIKVGHNQRIARHKVFGGVAERGKTTMGWFYGFKFHLIVKDQGYTSQPLFEQLFSQGLELITSVHKNIKNRLMALSNKLLLRKRYIIETINDQLKNISQIEPTRHGSVANFLVNLFYSLIAYFHQPKKPSRHLSDQQLQLLCQYSNIFRTQVG